MRRRPPRKGHRMLRWLMCRVLPAAVCTLAGLGCCGLPGCGGTEGNAELAGKLVGEWEPVQRVGDAPARVEFTTGGKVLLTPGDGAARADPEDLVGVFAVSGNTLAVGKAGDAASHSVYQIEFQGDSVVILAGERLWSGGFAELAGKWRRAGTAAPGEDRAGRQLAELQARAAGLEATRARRLAEQKELAERLRAWSDRDKPGGDSPAVRASVRDLRAVEADLGVLDRQLAAVRALAAELGSRLRDDARRAEMGRVGLSDEEMAGLAVSLKELEEKAGGQQPSNGSRDLDDQMLIEKYLGQK